MAVRLKRAALVLAGLACAAQAEITVPASAAGLTAVAVDGKCNLTEAFQSMQLGPASPDCVKQNQTRTITLQGANTVFQLTPDITLFFDMKIATSDAGVVIEAAGLPLHVNTGCTLTLTGPSGGLTIRVKSGSVGRALYNGSWSKVIGTNIIFQGGASGASGGGVVYNPPLGRLNLTGGAIQGGTAIWGGGLYNESQLSDGVVLRNVKVQNNTASRDGGGIFNAGPRLPNAIKAERCAIQNNTAGQRGGGVYNDSWLELSYCAVKGNKAGQGGGIFHQKYDNNGQPNIYLFNSTISDNKAIATEFTSDGTASTNSTPCSSVEGAGQAFDDNFATKWCGGGFVPSVNQPIDIQFSFSAGASKFVSSYSLTSANDLPGRDPVDWKFQGWNGTAWLTLHTVTNYPKWTTRHQTESFNAVAAFPFTNAGIYKQYRLRITRNAGNVNATQLAEVQLYPFGQTGDGGGIFSIGHMNTTNVTLSGNIAGCTTPSCACTSPFCATTSGTSPAMGKGGGIYAGDPPPESIFDFVTVAGNSASQGGGVYTEYEHWAWWRSLIGKNTARTNRSPHPDFHGNPHEGPFGYHEVFIQNPAGTTGLVTGFNKDVINQDPLLNELADNGGLYPELHPLTHALQAGSPAKDRAVSVGSAKQDERGVVRPQGPYPDMGAFEQQ